MSEALFYNVNEFCNAARISRSLFYALQRKGTGPRVTRVGDRSLVSVDDARLWASKIADRAEPGYPEAHAA